MISCFSIYVVIRNLCFHCVDQRGVIINYVFVAFQTSMKEPISINSHASYIGNQKLASPT